MDSVFYQRKQCSGTWMEPLCCGHRPPLYSIPGDGNSHLPELCVAQLLMMNMKN